MIPIPMTVIPLQLLSLAKYVSKQGRGRYFDCLIATRLSNHKVPHIRKHGFGLIVGDGVAGVQDVVVGETALDVVRRGWLVDILI